MTPTNTAIPASCRLRSGKWARPCNRVRLLGLMAALTAASTFHLLLHGGGQRVASAKPAAFIPALTQGAGGDYAAQQVIAPTASACAGRDDDLLRVIVPASLRSCAESAAAEAQYYQPPAWTLWAQQHGASETTLALLTDIGGEYARDGYDMPCLLACIANPESSFNPGCRGAAGERGLAQIHPCHRRTMAALGLDFNSEADRLRFACHLITDALDNGATLRTALRPWTTRRKALAQYFDMEGLDHGTD